MILLTKLDGKQILINAEWIQSVEKTPDTLITLTNGFKLMVKEPLESVERAFIQYQKQVHTPQEKMA